MNTLKIILCSLFFFSLQAYAQVDGNERLITGISNVRIKVADVESSIRFYCEGLGLKLAYKDANCAFIETPDKVYLEIMGGGINTANTSGITHICLNTYDVDKTFVRALEYGGKPSRPDSPEPSTYNGLRMGFVATPTGEEVELWYIEKNGIQRETVIGDQYIKCFVHPAITVPDMPASVKFYEALGIRLKMDWGWGCSMQLADNREMELFTEGSYSDNKNSYIHIGFFVTNLEKAIEKAVEMGGVLLSKSPVEGNRQSALIRSLAGEVIELVAVDATSQPGSKYRTNTPQKLINLFD